MAVDMVSARAASRGSQARPSFDPAGENSPTLWQVTTARSARAAGTLEDARDCCIAAPALRSIMPLTFKPLVGCSGSCGTDLHDHTWL